MALETYLESQNPLQGLMLCLAGSKESMSHPSELSIKRVSRFVQVVLHVVKILKAMNISLTLKDNCKFVAHVLLDPWYKLDHSQFHFITLKLLEEFGEEKQ